MACLAAIVINNVFNCANDKEEANGEIQISGFEDMAVGY
jgi:hypothetical protein